ncbi:CPBP family intramembrane glutamic endopeptidase [Bacillus pseudomycoides]|uniref:CPBP family intramembrane glutamic endopeptidase n=1 Tax=Bacillus pseudomycoides TaxID=64104 RepID=UPI000BFD10F7|nr:type II CAAX endopeptidase family protein [Bacillus pseudomycoides]PGD99995.1 CPBP family intramembrane metalloprotease [Bacillus pseudomycoides]PHG19664.1 CPBP family intramembrane metalloprotease [Bacillus pseudomycoides]
MNETVLNMNNTERKESNITYKNLLAIILGIFGISFVGGMFFALAAGVYGEEVTKQFSGGYYWLLIDAIAVMLVLFLYKPARYFITDIWNISVLKTGKTYIYVLFGFIVIALSQYIMLGLLGIESSEQQQSQLGTATLQNNMIQSIIYILSVAVITPIKEEIIYRGILYRFLEKKYSFLVGMIVSSVVFGFLHGGLAMTAMIMGIVFAILYKKTNSVVPSIILHISWNLFVSVFTIMTL